MKKLLLICSIFFLGNANINAQLLTESFETDGEGSRYTSNPFQVSCDFFLRDNNSVGCLTNNPTGLNGSFYWTGEDTDSNPDASGAGTLTLNPIAVTGFALDMDVLLGIGRPNEFRFEPNDELLFQYNMDGGGWITFAAFYGSNDGVIPGFTGNLVQDTDLNGAYNPGAPEINTSAMQNWNFTIPATGNSLQVRFIMGQNGGSEEIMIDYIRINGSAACTAPDVPIVTATPSAVCPGSSSTLSWTGSLNDATAWHVYTTSCGVTQLTTTAVNSLVVSPGATTTYYIRGEDGAGCVDESTGSCGSVTVTVQDITNPTITCPGNQVGSVNGACNYVLPDYTGLAVAADNCTASPTVTQSPVAGTVVGTGTTVVTLTATDGSANTANCNFNVVVSDNTNPTITCPANQVGSVNGACTYVLPDYTPLATAADNCPGVAVTQVPVAGTVVGIGTTNIVFTATDGSSNTANCNFNVVVSDNTNPTITCPADQNEAVNASCQFSLPDYTGLAVVADNCNPAPSVTQLPIAGTTITGAVVVTLTVNDGNGNTASCNFNSIGVDNTNPTISCPANQNESFNATCNFTLPDYTGLAVVADNCNPAPAVTQSPIAGTVISSTTTITLTVNDGSGNTANCTFDVIPTDNTNPTITCSGNQTENPNSSCQFTLPDYTGLATASDNCAASPSVTQSPVSGTVISGTTTITLTANDGNGNTAQCTFDVVLNDVTAPTAVCLNINAVLDGAGNATIIASALDGGSTDNCGAVTFSASQTAFTCADLGTNNVTLTVTDGNSNSSNCVAVVTVIDNTNPTVTCPGNQTENPDASCQFTLPDYTVAATVSAADNCTALPTISQSPAVGTAIGLGATVVTLTADDGNGNTTSCNFTVTVASSITGNQTLTECDGFSITINSNTYTSTGIYTDVLVGAASNGCDSTLTTDLTVLPALTGSVNNTICDGDSVVVNGTIYNAANPTGTEVFTVGANNCDSTVNVNLTINSIDNTVTNISPTLTANQFGATYQWLDCDNSNAIIPSETNQAFTATTNGSYAVEITIGACVDTSACVNVIISGLEDNAATVGLTIYPNPTNGVITIQLDQVNSNAIVTVYNLIGMQLINQKLTKSTNVDLSSYDNGVYFIKIKNGGQVVTKRVVKQ